MSTHPSTDPRTSPSTDNTLAPATRSVWEDPSRDWTPEGLLARACWLCRSVAATTWLPDTPARVDMADRYDYDEHELTSRYVDVGALAALDRELLAWLGVQFQYAARRVRGRGVLGADVRAVRAAEALVRDGGVRPAGQDPIAMWPHDGDDGDTGPGAGELPPGLDEARLPGVAGVQYEIDVDETAGRVQAIIDGTYLFGGISAKQIFMDQGRMVQIRIRERATALAIYQALVEAGCTIVGRETTGGRP
jgi:hypothetical protein